MADGLLSPGSCPAHTSLQLWALALALLRWGAQTRPWRDVGPAGRGSVLCHSVLVINSEVETFSVQTGASVVQITRSFPLCFLPANVGVVALVCGDRGGLLFQASRLRPRLSPSSRPHMTGVCWIL